MSLPTLHSLRSLVRAGPDPEERSDGRSDYTTESLRSRVQFVGFWTAVALPFAHLALLVRGLTSVEAVGVFVALLVVNVLALYVGHGYDA